MGSNTPTSDKVLIPYIGTSYGTLSVGSNTVSDNILNNGKLIYDFWYY
jgi:hypothetical protein